MNAASQPHCDYLLADSAAEVERLKLQSAVWEPATGAWLKTLPIPEGANALDLGCGAIGALPVLSRLVGPGGSVTGADLDLLQVERARRHAREHDLGNVTVVRADACATGLPGGSFDLVHIRFLERDRARPLLRGNGFGSYGHMTGRTFTVVQTAGRKPARAAERA